MVLLLGVACQVGQVVYLRELLMVFHGNELSLGVILAAWMIWTGIGSRLGAVVLSRYPHPLRLLRADAAVLTLLMPATVLAIRVLPGVFQAPPGALPSLAEMALSSLLVMAPSTSLLGAQFVLLARIWREREGTLDASGAAKTYVGEAWGNVLGGLLFTLLLVHYLDAFQLTLLVTGAMLVALAARRVSRLVIAAAAIVLMAMAPLLDSWSSELLWSLRAREHQLVASHQSRYGTVSVLRHEDQYSFFQSGHLVFSTGGATDTAVALEEQEGVRLAHVAMTQHPDPQRVLLIGGGLRGTLREILLHPVTSVDYVELDPVLIEAARPHLPPGTRSALADSRVRLIHADGRLFVKGGARSYDLVIVDVPDPTTAVLNRHYTQEFFAEARALLEPDGVLAIGAISTPDLRGSAIANRNSTLYHTLRTVFLEVLPVGDRYLYFFASNAPGLVTADVPTLMARFSERGVESEGFAAGHLALVFDEGPLRRVNWVLRNHGRSVSAHLEPPPASPLRPGTLAEQRSAEPGLPNVHERFFVNSDLRPVGYYHTLMFWSVLSGAGDAVALRWIARVQWWWVFPPVALLIAVAALLRAARVTRARSAPRFAVMLAVFTTGLSTMTMQIALLFAFQSVYGFVYEMVGLIVALFMAGLALGAMLTQRFVPDKSDRRVLALVQATVAVFALAIGVALPEAAGLGSAAGVFASFALFTFFAGVLNGADFPLAAACYLALDRRPERSAATVYAVELLGACSGAAIASVVVAPVLGIVACALLAAVANATAFVALALTGLGLEDDART